MVSLYSVILYIALATNVYPKLSRKKYLSVLMIWKNNSPIDFCKINNLCCYLWFYGHKAFYLINFIIYTYHLSSSFQFYKWISVQSVQSLGNVQLFVTPRTAAHLASLSITNSQSYPLSRWCHPTISFSIVPLSSCLQYFQTSGPFQISHIFTSGGQSIGVSTSTSVFPMNIQDWFPLGWTGWISLQTKRLSRVFCNTTVQKYQFFGAQLSL